MFRTRNGTAMPAELVLQIILDMEYGPGVIENIMGTSKTLRELLSRYEYSISRRMSATLCQSTTPCIRSSTPKRSSLFHSTYPWLHELHMRSAIIPTLKTGPLLSGDLYIFALDDKKAGYLRDKIIDLLYQFSDLDSQSHDRSSDRFDSHSLRVAQENWIISDQCSQEDLAVLYALVNVISDKWRTLENERRKRLASYSSAKDPATNDQLHAHTESTTEDLSLDSRAEPINLPTTDVPWQREEDCVYRECCLIYGPYFLRASISTEDKEIAFFKKVMSRGLRELRSFEDGTAKPRGRGSLQGLIARRFCEMVDCSMIQGWVEVWSVIDSLKIQ